MKTINRTAIGTLMNELQITADKLAAEHGLTCKVKGTYGDTSGSVKIEFETTSEDGLSEDARRTWEMYAGSNYCNEGLTSEMFGQHFMHDGIAYQIVGWKPRASKRPIVCRSIDRNGKNRDTVWTRDSVVRLMAIANR